MATTPAQVGTRVSAPPLAVDPRAGRLNRALLRTGAWLRPVRWLVAGLAGYMAVQLVPYFLWEGPAPAWALGGLAVTAAVWGLLPGAVALARRRAVIDCADLGVHSEGAALLALACDARQRFQVAAGQLDDAQRWVRDARRRLAETTWSVAGRGREMSRLHARLAEVSAGTDGPFRQAEEARLGAELATQAELTRDLTAEMVHLADVAERTALAMSARREPVAALPELSPDERGAVDALRWFRLRLEAVEQAWVELNRL